ncbi:SDR family NAD(P)-dependent oxidoreductase [Mucilaginibacter sp. CAU 1740]|uniref:SDR family NAD(P)-dependent oxidoreductase n=1 Tax=Mucilaginibacter sp. CAU 1740 TaxID=3140365 RepID=UPI00325B29E3
MEKAYIITGPTSGIGKATALKMAGYGKLILVGRNFEKLRETQAMIENNGGTALPVVCDLSDMDSVRKAAQEIVALGLPIAGLLNNAGIMPGKALQSMQGWDLTYATNHLGPFALTEALMPSLPNGANVVFIVSAIEDPERKPVKAMGLKGGRYISAEASARGEWLKPGSKIAGMDAYATSKQCLLAASLYLAQEHKRLHINAIEPGITRGTGLGAGSTPAWIHGLFGRLMAILPPFSHYASTPERSADVIVAVLTDTSGKTGQYISEKGVPMKGSALVHDPVFREKVVKETRALLT